MKAFFSKLLNLILTVVLCCIVGTLLLTLINILPVKNVIKNVSTDLSYSLGERESSSSFFSYILQSKESYTDAIMIQNAMEDIEGVNAFSQSMFVYHSDFDSEIWTPMESIKYIASGNDTSSLELISYGRYWHGYLVPLKLILELLPLNAVYVLNALLQLVLFGFVVYLGLKKGYPGIPISMFVGYLFMKPELILTSFAMSIISYIVLIMAIVLLNLDGKLYSRSRYFEFFALTGCAVAYFDFLTYPVVTLGYLLCFYFLIHKEQKLTKNLLDIVHYVLCWMGGYGAMWVSKWIVADLTVHGGIFKNAFSSFVGWTDVLSGLPRNQGLAYTLSLIINQYNSPVFYVLLALILLFDLVIILQSIKIKTFKTYYPIIITLLLVALIPIGWLLIVEHHSGVHAHFVFRIMSIAPTALFAMGFSQIKKPEN